MPLPDLLSDIFTSFLPTAHAEAPDQEADDKSEGEEEEKSEEAESSEEGEREAKAEEEEEEESAEEAEEEEEEDEPEDIKPKLEEECSRSAQCAPHKHHYDECVERVTEQHDNPHHKGPKEDCVEEFFHLSHCATQCAAPKLFRALK